MSPSAMNTSPSPSFVQNVNRKDEEAMTQKKVLLATIALLSILALFPLAPAQAFLGLFEGKEIRQDETQKTLTETIVDE